MYLLAHESEDAAKASAQSLRAMGARARTLLAECVEHQEVSRGKLSQAASQLSDAGFIFVVDTGDMWQPSVMLRPSLVGEEALEMLEMLEEFNKMAGKTKQ